VQNSSRVLTSFSLRIVPPPPPTRHTNDLSVHCDRENIPYIPFETFDKVQEVIARIVDGKSTVQDELAQHKK
jgi:hypothetical protein